jgi:hypothetical protein
MDNIIVYGSIATAFNIVVIYYKFTHHKLQSAVVDTAVLVILSILFAGTVSGLSIGMIASFVFSIYLLIIDITKKEEPMSDIDKMLNDLKS